MVGPVGQVKDAFVSYKWTAPECLNLGEVNVFEFTKHV